VLEQIAGPALIEARVPLRDNLRVGRHPENELVLADPAVSRHHLRIESEGGKLQVIDLGSRVGTALNDHPLPAFRPVPIREHDRLRVGPWRFRLISADSQPRVAYPPLSDVSLSSATQTLAPALVAERRLELLVEFAAAAAHVTSAATLAACVADFAVRGCNARYAVIYVRESGLQELARHPQVDLQFEPDLAVAQASLAGGVVQVEGAGAFALAVTLRLDQLPWGVLWVVLDATQERSRSDACEFAHALSRLAGLTLGNLDRREVALRIERLHNDLDQAREVQRRILPPPQGQFGGLSYALHVHPGRHVAGDLADVLQVADGRVAVVLGDVAGAGVGAGFLMAGVQAYLHAELMETGDPAVAAQRCNAYLAKVGGARFVTAWIGVIDLHHGECHYVDAGHGHVRLVGNDRGVHELSSHGCVPLGVAPDSEFVAERLQLGPGLRVVLYSDGVAEQRSPDARVFADHGLGSVLEKSCSPAEDVELVVAGLSLFGGGQLPADDATILSMCWSGPV